VDQPKKIAFVCHPYHRGGVTRWMADAAIAAADAGCDAYFVTVDPTTPFQSGAGREKMVDMVEVPNGSLRVVSNNVNYFFEFGTQAFRAGIYASMITKNVPPGTPLVLSDDAAVWAAAAALADTYPMIGVMHGNDAAYYGLAREYSRELSVCVCVSSRIRNILIANCPALDAAKVVVIPCGILLPVFVPVPSGNGLIRMAFVGRIEDKVKRATDLVGIAAALHRKGIGFHLNIVGNDKESATRFSALFREQGVEEFVTFRGWQDKMQIQALLNASDLLLLTSNSEGMPLVMMEALASGTGFVGTRVSGIEDYEFHPLAKDCFGVYAVGDITDAVEKITTVAAVPVSTRRQSARDLAASAFSMDVCLYRYFETIARIKPSTFARPINLSVSDSLHSRLLALARWAKVKLIK